MCYAISCISCIHAPYTYTYTYCCIYCCRVETKIKEFKYIPETLAANKDLRKIYTNNNTIVYICSILFVYVLSCI